MQAEDERFCFLVEWYDELAAFHRKFKLMYYPKDATIEMVELFEQKNQRQFLRRTTTDTLRAEDLYIGSSINIHSRQLTIVDYADSVTQKRLEHKQQRTLGLVKPNAVKQLGPILDQIHQHGFLISKLKMCQLSRQEALQFYEEHQSKDFFNALVSFMSSGPVIAFELMGNSAILKWRELLGPTDSAIARSEAPTSLRARFGTDSTQNACHGSDSAASAARELEFFFPSSGNGGRENTATASHCTCCVIKPHAVLNGCAGKILQRVMENFDVSALQMFHMTQANSEEFYEVYKGVVAEYHEMVMELMSGPSIALEIRPKGGIPIGEADTIVKSFREFAGPADPEIARHLRGHTLRAQFGQDKVKNGIHCTDLPEDGILEVEYFFRILNQ